MSRPMSQPALGFGPPERPAHAGDLCACGIPAVVVYAPGWGGGIPHCGTPHTTRVRHPRPVATCGTHPGYVAHRARGEDPCPACKQAHNAYQQDLRDARKAAA